MAARVSEQGASVNMWDPFTEAHLTGLHRAAPVLFSVPGQFYDFDESKSRHVAAMKRTAVTSPRRRLATSDGGRLRAERWVLSVGP
jgi:hypothetical protein